MSKKLFEKKRTDGKNGERVFLKKQDNALKTNKKHLKTIPQELSRLQHFEKTLGESPKASQTFFSSFFEEKGGVEGGV